MCFDRFSPKPERGAGCVPAARFSPGRVWPRLCGSCLGALAVVVLLAGCAPRYKIVLNNGNIITTRGKPKYDAEAGVYRFKDTQGMTNYVPAFRVKGYEPM
jgi:hypothetical protein